MCIFSRILPCTSGKQGKRSGRGVIDYTVTSAVPCITHVLMCVRRVVEFGVMLNSLYLSLWVRRHFPIAALIVSLAWHGMAWHGCSPLDVLTTVLSALSLVADDQLHRRRKHRNETARHVANTHVRPPHCPSTSFVSLMPFLSLSVYLCLYTFAVCITTGCVLCLLSSR